VTWCFERSERGHNGLVRTAGPARVIRWSALAGALIVVAALAPAAAVVASTHGTIVSVDANQSNNWSGYNQGALEKGALFNSITGTWTVPKASQHAAHQAEASSVWIGIGGGCPEPNCLAPSETLIQLGTEQDVGKRGRASYSAWWELIPVPSVTITGFPVRPGDRIKASIHEAIPDSNLWVMSMRNVTAGKTWSQTVPYTSTHDTVEWIVETPLTFGTSGAGLADMPNLTTVRFDKARVNGHGPGFQTTEEIQLVDTHNHPIATPSAPDAQRDGFNVCTWASRCAAP